MTTATEYVDSRRVGAITVTAINDAIMPMTINLTVPEAEWRQGIDADAEGKVPIAVHVLLVQTGEATILIDAALDEPGSPWEESLKTAWPGSTRTPGVVEGLAAVGVSREDITHIIITHVHFDHIIGLAAERDGRLVPRYPNARVLIGRGDWEDVPEGHLSPEGKARIQVYEALGRLILIDGECEIVPGVTVIPAPGESPGHQAILVSSNGEELYAVGDLFHHWSEVEHLDWMVPWAGQDQMLAARRTVLDAAASSNALVVFTHEPFPPWGRISRDGSGGYRWQRT
jgi:glyoxylase-like metal-dependent hydrolase (beta-lactamase superfamily II)